jgi:hypothetical protein
MSAVADANQQARAILSDRSLGYGRVPTDATAQAQVWATLALAEALGRVANQLNTIARAVCR